MEREASLNRIIELAFKWQQKHEWAAAFKAADRFREYRAKGSERFDALSEEKHALVIAAHGEFVAMENLLRSHAPQFLELVPDVNFFEPTADYAPQIRDLKKLEGAVRTMFTDVSPDKNSGSGRKPDADRTQGKNSGKNFRPWDANCERIAKAYIRQCVNNGSEIARLPFIKEELRKNATRYPKAKAASTIDRAFRENEGCWQPALLKALSERTQTGRKK